MMRIWVILVFVCAQGHVLAQDALRFGISARPIVPFDWLDTGPETLDKDELSVTIAPRFGFNFGMFIQKPISRQVAFETGINMVRRNYKSTFEHTASDTSASLNFAFVGYEIPVQALFFVQLGDQVWMNGSAGFSFDMYPSETFSTMDFSKDAVPYEYIVSSLRYGWVQLALVANYGFEVRTKKDDAIYLGATYHRPFSAIARTRSRLEIGGPGTTVEHQLNGSYLTVDLRYIFAEKAQRRK